MSTRIIRDLQPRRWADSQLRTCSIAIVSVAIALLGVAGCSLQNYGLRSFRDASSGEPIGNCYFKGRGGVHITSIGLSHVDDEWYLAGRIRGPKPLTSSKRHFRVEAVEADETIVFASSGTANKKIQGGLFRRKRSATFRVRVPDPESFDHLHFALIGSRREHEPLQLH